MNKKLMAVAIAGALGAPALAMAQASNTTIYGRANVGIDSWKATGSTAGPTQDFKTRTRVFDSGSRVGFRGTEDLGGGLRAVYVIETGVNIDNGNNTGQSGLANASTGFWASRDSYAGLEGNWGRLTWGRQSIYWVGGVLSQSGANYINTDVQSTGNLGRIQTGVARQSNTMAYNSPTMGGFNFTLSYAPNSEGTGVNTNANATIFGATARYFGVVNAQVDYVQNKSATGTGPAGSTPKNTGVKAGVGWPYMPGAQIAVWVINQKMDNQAAVANFIAAGDSPKATAYIVNWEHIFGKIQALAEFGKLNKAKGCTESAGAVPGVSGTTCEGTDATAYMVAGRYLFSKRTAGYVSYVKYNNKANQLWDSTGAGMSSAAITNGPFTSVGADPTIIALGVLHNF